MRLSSWLYFLAVFALIFPVVSLFMGWAPFLFFSSNIYFLIVAFVVFLVLGYVFERREKTDVEKNNSEKTNMKGLGFLGILFLLYLGPNMIPRLFSNPSEITSAYGIITIILMLGLISLIVVGFWPKKTTPTLSQSDKNSSVLKQ